MRKCSREVSVIKMHMFSKIFTNFYVCVLTHHNSYCFLIHFLDELTKIFFALVQCVAGWSAVIQNWTFFLGRTWKSPFVDSINFCIKCVRPAQTYANPSNTHARCMQLCSKRLNKIAVWKWRLQSMVNVSSGLCKGFIMND